LLIGDVLLLPTLRLVSGGCAGSKYAKADPMVLGEALFISTLGRSILVGVGASTWSGWNNDMIDI
jgi:hypothetical protein